METSELIDLLKKAQGSRTLNSYAQQANVSAGNLSRIMNGQKPTPEILKKLAEKSHNGVTYTELMNAAGYIEGTSFSTPTLTAHLGTQIQNNVTQITKVPILGCIRAGLPILASENWEGEIDLAEDIRADFALRVEGDSMSWVGICEGDLGLFRQENTAQQGDIIAAGVEDNEWCATLKYYIVENGEALLRAANPNYKDMIITEKHRIIGTLVGVYKQSPSIMEYKKFLIDKEMNTKGWGEAIEKATQYGLESKQLIQLIELFSHMIRHVK
jgi:repressor LexA